MTVRELISALLDSPMDEKIQLYLEDNHVDEYGIDCSGYVFDIDGVEHQTLIRFTDWRKE